MGDMGEVGDNGPAFHVEVGEYARQQGIDRLLTLGSLARHSSVAFGGTAAHFRRRKPCSAFKGVLQ